VAQIIARNVTKTYKVGSQPIHAVQDASLTIEKGDFLSIVGHSGSGKTTLLSLIGGITNPTSGAIFFEGNDISALETDRLSEYRSEKVGFMFQFASLLPMLTVKENLLLPTLFSEKNMPKERARQKAADLIRMVGLSDKFEAYPSQLSGGQQRRVAIARAFMNHPAVILADEPTGDLDEETEQDMMNFFKTMNHAEEITFIMVTHNTDLARQTKRQLRMHQGFIQEKEGEKS
jgi:putative ABC transport system ATP-binding protein/lipoprotein-releasing system ATP-binding protein